MRSPPPSGLHVRWGTSSSESAADAPRASDAEVEGLPLAVTQVLLAGEVKHLLDLCGHDLDGVLGSAPRGLVDDRDALGVVDGLLQPDLALGQQRHIDVV